MNAHRFILKCSLLLMAPIVATTSSDGLALAQTTFANAKKSPLPSKTVEGLRVVPTFLQAAKRQPARPKVTESTSLSADAPIEITTQSNTQSGSTKTLPLWTFDVKAGRDGDHHPGAMVGHDPFHNPGTDKIPTYLVPLVIRTHTIATAYDSKSGTFSTGAGDTTIDPTQADDTCLTAPNNIPVALVRQSPVFSPAHFVFGGTDVGTTQYIDAFQRANFWNVLGSKASQYHVLLDPIETEEPFVLDVPPNEGLALTDPALFQKAYGLSFCAPMLIIDINWFDSYLVGTLLAKLQEADVDPSTLPIFLTYNTVWASPVADFYTCCVGGYHGLSGFPIPTQTYAVVDWDSTGFFQGPSQGLNADVLSHEIAEWTNDPYIVNETPSWGNTGQVIGCDPFLEVGDPLTGTDLPPVTMPNGYPYDLQELAFFSWFEGGVSTGTNGWYSNNGTFKTNAGPVCP